MEEAEDVVGFARRQQVLRKKGGLLRWEGWMDEWMRMIQRFCVRIGAGYRTWFVVRTNFPPLGDAGRWGLILRKSTAYMNA